MDKRLIINLAISLGFLIILLYLVGIDRIVDSVLTMRTEFYVLGLLVYLCVTLLMSYRIKVVLKAMGEDLSLRQVIPSNLAGLLASDFTPARVGYFFTAFSLSSKFKLPVEKTITTIFGPQLFDFLIKIVSAALLTLWILSITSFNNLLVTIAVIAGALFAVLFAGLLVFYPSFLDMLAFAERIPFVPQAFAFLRRMHQHSNAVLQIKSKVVLITIASWVAKGLEWLLISKALGIIITGDLMMDLLFMMVLQGAVTILQFIPSPTIAGAGASEAAFAVLLLPFNVPFQTSIIFGVFTRITMILVDAFSIPVILEYLRHQPLEKLLDKVLAMGH